MQIRRPRNARKANSAAVCFRTHDASGVSHINLSACRFGNQLRAGMFQRHISAAGFEMGQSSH